jgi:orotate phosphoribosyltransferase
MFLKELTEEESLEYIRVTGAIREGHFVLTSGRHSPNYVNKDDVSTLPHRLDVLAYTIERAFKGRGVQVVAAPAVGAIALGNRVAYHFGGDVIAVFAESDGDDFVFRRDYARFIKPRVKVLLVEDIVTTGKTTWAMIRVVEALGGEVVGVGLLRNRSQEEFPVPVFACVNRAFPTYDPIECLLCKESVPISTEVGHGHAFLTEFGEDPAGWPANKGK